MKCAVAMAFAKLARQCPNRTLVRSVEADATRGDVDEMSREIAARFAGLTPEGAIAGLSIGNGPSFLAGFLALRRMGHPVLLLDPSAPEADQHRALSQLGAHAVLVSSSAWATTPRQFELRQMGSLRVRFRTDIAVIKLTSGTTGTPRGVALTAAAALADESALANTMGLRGDDQLMASLPWSHSYGFTTLVLSGIVRGLTLLLPRNDDPLAPVTDGATLGATVMPTVPAYLQALVKMSSPPPLPRTLRLVLSAGAPLPIATAKRFRATYGQPVHVFYGSSETGGICYDRGGGAGERGSVGVPVDGVHVTLTPVDGVEDGGLVSVRSPAVGVSYLPEPDARLKDGRFVTSDIGKWRDGELVIEGRVDRVINVRGRKVDPSEVEAILSQLDGVEEALVFGTEDQDGHVVRAVVARRTPSLTRAQVLAWCSERLATHKVPRTVVIVEAIPRTSRGKIDWKGVRALIGDRENRADA